jgi:Polysaccharide deacetylase
MKPVLMIHAMSEDILRLPLAEYTLTFDDGLYSQWAFIEHLIRVPTDKVFFVSTKFLCTGEQASTFIPSSAAHDKARSGNYEDFMTPAQVQQLINAPGCYVGGHGHAHLKLREFPRLIDRSQAMIQDTVMMLAEFQRMFSYTPTKFCFPYNETLDGLYAAVVRRYGFTDLYGRERIPVETLLHTPSPLSDL